MTHDDKRHGTTTLFAALDVKSGMVIGECLPRHRAREFLKCLCRIDRAVPWPRDVHPVLDNYATHKTPEVQGLPHDWPLTVRASWNCFCAQAVGSCFLPLATLRRGGA